MWRFSQWSKPSSKSITCRGQVLLAVAATSTKRRQVDARVVSGFGCLALCLPIAWYDAYTLLHSEHSYRTCWFVFASVPSRALALLKNQRVQTAENPECSCFSHCVIFFQINLEAPDAHEQESAMVEPLGTEDRSCRNQHCTFRLISGSAHIEP